MYTRTHVARLLGKHVNTLALGERQGMFEPGRDSAGRRIYVNEGIDRLREIAASRTRPGRLPKRREGKGVSARDVAADYGRAA